MRQRSGFIFSRGDPLRYDHAVSNAQHQPSIFQKNGDFNCTAINSLFPVTLYLQTWRHNPHISVSLTLRKRAYLSKHYYCLSLQWDIQVLRDISCVVGRGRDPFAQRHTAQYTDQYWCDSLKSYIINWSVAASSVYHSAIRICTGKCQETNIQCEITFNTTTYRI